MQRMLIEEKYRENQERFIEEWKEYLRFKSVSTDPAFANECVACAEWLRGYLVSAGFSAELISTATKPLVFAESRWIEGAPTVLFYGHYDVQPAEALVLWKSDPFDPVVKNGRLYARGAQDNKGQNFAFLAAVRTLIEADDLHVNLKVLLEGEEECGSDELKEAIPSLCERLKADVLMVSDTGTVREDLATITMGLRGIIHLECALYGASYDLHSGTHGAVAPNPALEICRLVATLHDESGRIAVDGYYDGLLDVSESDLRLAEASDTSTEEYKEVVGVYPDGGERGIARCVREGFRPSIDINGLKGGYQGEGTKTIIPSYASVKITSRMAAGQDPERCLRLLKEHLSKHAPKSLEVRFSHEGVGGSALRLSSESEVVQKAHSVLLDLMGKEPVFSWSGASIHIVSSLSEASGSQALLVGFGLEEDNIHAPNESFAIEQFRKCFMYNALFLGSLQV